MAVQILKRWGNSLAVRIPANIASDLSLEEGQEVQVEAVDGRVSVWPHRAIRRFSRERLIQQFREGKLERHEEIDFGDPVGTEWGGPKDPTRGGRRMKQGIPDAGDVVRLHIGPSRGNEQDGYRAVLVISDITMNDITGRFTGLPITSTMRGWETEVPIASLKRPGVALVDQMLTLSYVDRELSFKGETVTEEELDAAKFAIRAFLQL